MRTYKSNRPTAEKSKKRMSKKGVYALAASASVVLIAVALTLSLTFGLRSNVPADEQDKPVVNDPIVNKITFTAPLTQCTVTNGAALNKLVYNDTLKQWRTHNGVDFEAAAGSDVLSVADGTVKSVENTILEGVVVTVEHAEGYVTIYKGLETAAVEAGETVTAGAKLGSIGNMMCEKHMGAHLHLEMKKDGKYVAATDYIELENNK
ncbi:MAG: M23 family metallopeptidase [Clostridia bacterium]|nr:M23 family metallopeptidase [Clostridia bacterium]